MFALLMFVAISDQVPGNLLPLIQKLYAVQDRERKNTETKIRELRRVTGQGLRKSREQADDLAKQLAGSKRGAIPLFPVLGFQLQNHDIGQPYSKFAAVVQVISKSEVIVSNVVRSPAVVMDGRVQSRVSTTEFEFLLRGISTAGHADGQMFELPQCIHVTGSKTLTTVAGGTKTLLVAEPVDVDAIRLHWSSYVKSLDSK